MSRLIICTVFLIITTAGISQQNNPAPALTKQDYLKKSKTQRIIATSLLAGGSIAWLAGASKYMKQDDYVDGGGEAAMIIGGLAVLSSIPLYILASKNKKKARQMAFNNQRIPQIQNNSFVYRFVPSLTLKISL
ncbi:MAG TPA: hypothetical protein VIZ28_06670 [Chitinophagaceae bacterium]